jgi:hypothetical protein
MAKIQIFPQLVSSCCEPSSGCCAPAPTPNAALYDLVRGIQSAVGTKVEIEVADYSDSAGRTAAIQQLGAYLIARGFKPSVTSLGDMLLEQATPAVVIDGQLKFVAAVPSLNEILAHLSGAPIEIKASGCCDEPNGGCCS